MKSLKLFVRKDGGFFTDKKAIKDIHSFGLSKCKYLALIGMPKWDCNPIKDFVIPESVTHLFIAQAIFWLNDFDSEHFPIPPTVKHLFIDRHPFLSTSLQLPGTTIYVHGYNIDTIFNAHKSWYFDDKNPSIKFGNLKIRVRGIPYSSLSDNLDEYEGYDESQDIYDKSNKKYVKDISKLSKKAKRVIHRVDENGIAYVSENDDDVKQVLEEIRENIYNSYTVFPSRTMMGRPALQFEISY